MKNRRILFAVLAGLLVCVLASCASAGDPPVDTAEMEAEGNQFMTELNGIIPLREYDDALLEIGTLTVLDDSTYHLSALDAFYEEYRVGGEAGLTIIYRTKSFVVYKVVFTGATGYCYRYEINPADVNAINIEAQPVNEVSIDERTTGDLRSVDLTLSRPGAQGVILTFGNIVDEEEAAANAEE